MGSLGSLDVASCKTGNWQATSVLWQPEVQRHPSFISGLRSRLGRACLINHRYDPDLAVAYRLESSVRREAVSESFEVLSQLLSVLDVQLDDVRDHSVRSLATPVHVEPTLGELRLVTDEV